MVLVQVRGWGWAVGRVVRVGRAVRVYRGRAARCLLRESLYPAFWSGQAVGRNSLLWDVSLQSGYNGAVVLALPSPSKGS
jgi:hypothetical protein